MEQISLFWLFCQWAALYGECEIRLLTIRAKRFNIFTVPFAKEGVMRNRELPYYLRQMSREKFLSPETTVKKRLPFLDRDIVVGDDGSFTGDKNPHHFIYAQSLSKEVIFYLCDVAEAVRKIQKTADGAKWMRGLLPHKRAHGIFNQMSTRTRVSFMTAAELLGMPVAILDLAVSSEGKGESWSDTIDTLSAYRDVLFIRHSGKMRLEEAVWTSNQSEKRIPIINAGSGPDDGSGTYQHPTQMLLDVYTLKRSFENYGGMSGRTFVFCGDLNARVVRSLIYASRHFPPRLIYFICPPGRELKNDMMQFLDRRGIDFLYCDKGLADVIGEGDVFYLSRIQDEYDEKPPLYTDDDFLQAYQSGDKAAAAEISLYLATRKIEMSRRVSKPLSSRYVLEWKYRDLLKKSARILHALPKRDEIDPRFDHTPDPFHQFVYNRYQVQNGVWMRAAIFAYLFGVDRKILEKCHEQYG